MSELLVHEMYVIDLDETVLQADLVFEEMARLAIKEGLTSEPTIVGTRAEVESSGGSFDLMSHLLRTGVALDEIEGLQDAFSANTDGHDFLYPDARPMLEALVETETPNFILTTGGMGTQTAKLKACGLYEHPHVITDNPYKGRLITAMRTPDGGYATTANVGADGTQLVSGRHGVSLEDKAKGHVGLPLDCDGYLIRRGGALRQSQQGSVPERIMLINSLRPVTERIYRNAEISARA